VTELETETSATSASGASEERSVATAPVVPADGRALEYDQRSRQITRGQMRFFLLLLTINTFLFGAFICLPLASPFLKKTWEDYQARREEKRMLAATEEKQRRDAVEARGLIDACMKYSAPADEVVYAEAHGDVAKLLAVAGRAYLVDGSHPLHPGSGGLYGGGGGGGGGDGLFGGVNGDRRDGGILVLGTNNPSGSPGVVADGLKRIAWQPPAARRIPEALVAVMSASGNSVIKQVSAENSVFLHEMNTPSGQRRLVWVAISNQPEPVESREKEHLKYDIAMNRRLDAYVFDQDGANAVRTSVLIQTPRPDLVLVFAGESNGPVELQTHGEWRVLAGQLDKADRSHFTIAYEIAGRPGVIDGRLTDGDRLMLEPRVGRLVGWKSGEEYTWEMPAAAGAATGAAK
jgi:hypothetical protein